LADKNKIHIIILKQAITVSTQRLRLKPNVIAEIVWHAGTWKAAVRAELGGSYALAPNTKIALLGHYERAESAGVQDWGTLDGQALTGALTDYESYGAELGLRQYFKPRKGIILNSIRPYVEARAGVSRVDDIDVVNTQLGGQTFSANGIPLYEKSWVGTALGANRGQPADSVTFMGPISVGFLLG